MRDRRDFQIELIDKGQKEEHRHSAVQLLYMLDGSCSMHVGDRQYTMHRDDVLLINAMEPHRYTLDQGSLMASILIEYRMITSLMPEAGGIFLLNSMEKMKRPYGDIRRLFHELIYLETAGEHNTESRSYRDLYELLDILFLHCMVRTAQDREERRHLSDDEKLQQIIAYVNAHYQESFSLSALAKELYVSTSTLSRFFRRQTGMYFADYVSHVRLTGAVGEMRYTDKNLTRIAVDCGFSNASVFAKLFHEQYGMSPNAWRKMTREEEARQQERQAELRLEMEKRIHPSAGLRRCAVPGTQDELCIQVSETRRTGQPFSKVVTIGSLSALTRANVQFHLFYIAREMHITHARIWSIFAEDLQVTDGRSIGSCNYNAIDTVLDALVENRIAPYLDFGRRPDMAVRTMSEAVYTEEKDVRFTSRRIFEAVFEDFIVHLVRRYGGEEVGRWIFDFNEDPSYRGESTYYEDPAYDFMNVWCFGYRTIRKYVPGARVGGPVGVPNGVRDSLELFAREAVQRDCVPDFLSLILFPYGPSADGVIRRIPNPDFELRQLEGVRQMLDSLGLTSVPIHVVEWNMSVSTRNYLNDSCFRGAWICARASVMMQYAGIASVWIASDWVSSYLDSREILNGGGGMLTRDSIRKPAYFALQFLGRLGNTLLYADERLVVTMRNPESFMILAVNSVPFHVSYFLREEDEIRPDDADAMVSDGEVSVLNLQLKGLAEGDEYMIKTRSVSRQHGSILDEWKRFRYEPMLDRADVKYLQGICVPHMSMERKTVSGGRLSVRILLDVQEFQLIHIFKGRGR